MNTDELVNQIVSSANELARRTNEAQGEALQAGGVNDSWAMEVDRLHHLLDQTSNYIADDAVRPQAVQFNNGRAVRILTDEQGPYLGVSFVPPPGIPQPPLTPGEQAALDSLRNSDFIDRLFRGEFTTNEADHDSPH